MTSTKRQYASKNMVQKWYGMYLDPIPTTIADETTKMS